MRNKLMRLEGVGVLAILLFSVTAAYGTDTIGEILQEAREHDTVRFQAYVHAWVQEETDADFYIVRDSYGDMIWVRTTAERPRVGSELEIRGVVTVTSVGPVRMFISEEGRSPIGGGLDPGGGQPPIFLIVMIAGIGLVFLILVGLLIVLMRGRGAPAAAMPAEAAGSGAAPVGVAPMAGAPEPIEQIKGDTIRLYSPPPGTMKLLPGCLEVAAGEKVLREVRFFLPKGRQEAEFTFGRAAGKPYVHIQLEHGTVSSRQAKLFFADNSYRLINYSTTNSTKVNERELGENESVQLGDGDVIEMGVVKFVYHSK